MSGNISSHFVGLTGGLLMSMIAFSIVFLVIVGLMLMMMALKKFAGAVEAREAAKTAPAAQAPAAAAAAKPAASVVASEDDGELVAVITAAIAAICGAGARVVSFRPAPPRASASIWSMTGRLQNTEGFVD